MLRARPKVEDISVNVMVSFLKDFCVLVLRWWEDVVCWIAEPGHEGVRQ